MGGIGAANNSDCLGEAFNKARMIPIKLSVVEKINNKITIFVSLIPLF